MWGTCPLSRIFRIGDQNSSRLPLVYRQYHALRHALHRHHIVHLRGLPGPLERSSRSSLRGCHRRRRWSDWSASSSSVAWYLRAWNTHPQYAQIDLSSPSFSSSACPCWSLDPDLRSHRQSWLDNASVENGFRCFHCSGYRTAPPLHSRAGHHRARDGPARRSRWTSFGWIGRDSDPPLEVDYRGPS